MLIYTVITSLDGYVADENGNFDWAAPDEQVHQFVNDLERPVGTYLYGRRLYEVMQYWQTVSTDGEPSVEGDYAQIWQAADKVVYSRTLAAVSTPRTRLDREFDVSRVRALVASSDRPVSIGGPGLAAPALTAGLVEEIHQFLNPVIVGSGTHFLPPRFRTTLELVDEHRFDNGVVHLHYRVKR
jgi:dihydrofolate reductase